MAALRPPGLVRRCHWDRRFEPFVAEGGGKKAHALPAGAAVATKQKPPSPKEFTTCSIIGALESCFLDAVRIHTLSMGLE